MRLNAFPSARLSAIVFTFICGAASTAAFAAETPDPLDPAAPVPATTYQSTLPGTKGQYLKDTDVERRSWRTVFTPDGRFAAEPAALAGSMSKPAEPSAPMDSLKPVPAISIAATQSASGAASDTRGIVKSIDLQQGKVKLKHGPIEKFDMPGMTMLFRVKDPNLLNQVKKGDEVGVTLETDRGAMYITGFQK